MNNVFQFAFILLWVHSRFWIAELMLILNFFNLVSLYLRYSTTPRLVHIPVVSGPLAWTFVAILWNGAAMVGAHNLPARILANVVIWAIFVFGLLFLVAFKDYTIGFALSILAACMTTPFEMTSISANSGQTSTRRTSARYQDCRFAVDLCLCGHVASICLHSDHRNSWGFREGAAIPGRR